MDKKFVNAFLGFLMLVMVSVIIYFSGSAIYNNGLKTGLEQGKAEGMKEAKGKLLEPEEGRAYVAVMVAREISKEASVRESDENLHYFRINWLDCPVTPEVGRKFVVVNGRCQRVEEKY